MMFVSFNLVMQQPFPLRNITNKTCIHVGIETFGIVQHLDQMLFKGKKT